MPSWIVPSDTHSPSDTGHTTDHNHIADDLTLLANATPAINGPTSVSTAYTVLTTDTVILANAASAGFAVTLQTAVGSAGRILTVIKTDATGNGVTLTPVSAQTIDGFSSYTMTAKNWSVRIISDGANWHVLTGFGFTDNNVLDDGSGNMNITGAVAMNSHKVTGLANGTASTDASAFGQTLAGGNGSPLTTKGDLLTMNATPAPARLAVGAVNQLVGVSSGSPAWQIGFTLQSQTAAAGFTLANSTNTIITWTTPNDGGIHHLLCSAYIYATAAMTGGQINISFTDMGGHAISGVNLVSGGLAINNANWNFQIFPVAANTTVTISQGTALTAGAAKCWAEIWGC